MAHDVLDERKNKELKLVENNLVLDLSVEKQARKETEQKISKMIDEKIFSLRLDLAKEKKVREETEDKYAKELSDQIAKLQDDLEMEQRIR